MKKTKEEAAVTKEMLVNSAMDILSTTSYKAARLEDVARAVGVTRGAIYWHFQNKLNLYRHLIKTAFEFSMQDIYAILDSTRHTVKKIEDVMNYLLGEKLDSHQRSAKIYNLLFIEKPPGLEKDLLQVEIFFSTLFKKHEKVLQDGIKAGEIRINLDTRLETRAFYNFLWGYFTNSERFFSGYSKNVIKKYIKKTMINPIVVNHKGE
jgi:AcrR family transcriptional regulator